MDIVLFLVGISTVILLGFFSQALFDKTHIPDALLLFLMGIAIGPVLGYITPDFFANVEPLFVTLTLILILFDAGQIENEAAGRRRKAGLKHDDEVILRFKAARFRQLKESVTAGLAGLLMSSAYTLSPMVER